ncbi:patched domain-containing protein 3-like isoform X2 [Tigriopus californicus]|uniref:patched domain-containing protein 3-like isoform X2 n=1 Tax=Tigriopus californicus TaxID=6832 RepID=UPI0027DAA0C4|nr:patched domain-containing protein 3-like isoform X2 [Tigriopus californicus]
MCSQNFVDKFMRIVFSWLGRQVGQRPVPFIIVPLLMTVTSFLGFYYAKHASDPEFLFLPINGEAKYERAITESFFPTNYSAFDPGRITRNGRFGRLLITAQDNETLLRDDMFREMLILDELVRNMTFSFENQTWKYEDVCAQNNGQCWKNDILLPASVMAKVENKTAFLTYPIWFSPLTFDRVIFPFFAGGIQISKTHTINSIYVVSLNYFLKSGTKEDMNRGQAWERAFLDLVGSVPFDHIKVARFSSLTLEIELENNTNSVMPYFSINIAIMVIFCVITCMMSDWVRSKPYLGLIGVVSALLGSITAFGVVMLTGVPFIGINLAAPFLMLGIGIDDTFVFLSAWRRTNPLDDVPKRMSNCFEDSAVSITITSLTDMLSFFVGVITPFPSVKIFCIYTGTAVGFTYLFHIFFFGACLAISGYAEDKNRHAFTCLTVLPKSLSSDRSYFYRLFCSGGINRQDPGNREDHATFDLMEFFRGPFSRFLLNRYARIMILLTFFVYVAVALYGVSNLKEGLERKNLARLDSYSLDFYTLEDTYFRDYPYRVSVVFSGKINYSDPLVQLDVEEIMQRLENTTFIDPIYSESWLRDFLDYVKRNEDYDPIDISTEERFVDALMNIYLGTPFNPYLNDVHLDDGKVDAARFLIQGKNIKNAVDEKIFVQELRDVCKSTSYNVSAYHPYFMYFDQFLLVLPMTIQCVTVAAVIMMVIALVFIPKPICALWVAFSIVSIEIGVIGFMTLWGVTLDSISMINLIMCIGFSVDFSAHISYHFMAKANLDPADRVADSMHALGLPITQGAISTILGVVGLVMAPSYIFIIFFKMVFLVIFLGALHGLFLLPVLLTTFGTNASSNSETKKLNEMNCQVNRAYTSE